MSNKEKGYKNLEIGRGWNKGKDSRIELECPVCKKKFKRYKASIRSKNVFCSSKCAYKGRSLGLVKRNINKPYKKQPISKWRKKKCKICGKNYISNTRSQKYCSRKCFEVAHKENMAGENNPSYINGQSYNNRSWRGHDWTSLRREIYKRDNYTCQDCGVKCESKRDYNNPENIIQCHHIEKYSKGRNNKKSNLITLCLKCHLKRHQKKI